MVENGIEVYQHQDTCKTVFLICTLVFGLWRPHLVYLHSQSLGPVRQLVADVLQDAQYIFLLKQNCKFETGERENVHILWNLDALTRRDAWPSNLPFFLQ